MAILIRASGETIKRNLNFNHILTQIRRDFRIRETDIKPIPFVDVENQIGKEPALLMLSLLKSDSKVSKEGMLAMLEVMDVLSWGDDLLVAELDYRNEKNPLFIFKTRGNNVFADDLLGTDYSAYFRIRPEHHIPKAILREPTLNDKQNGNFILDLLVDLYVTSKTNRDERKVATVYVEYDGDYHLRDKKVREDKLRDSMVQSTGATVFRIQNIEEDMRSRKNRPKFNAHVNNHAKDIIEHFRNRLLMTIPPHPIQTRGT